MDFADQLRDLPRLNPKIYRRFTSVAIRFAYYQNIRTKNLSLVSLETVRELLNFPRVISNYRILLRNISLVNSSLDQVLQELELVESNVYIEIVSPEESTVILGTHKTHALKRNKLDFDYIKSGSKLTVTMDKSIFDPREISWEVREKFIPLSDDLPARGIIALPVYHLSSKIVKPDRYIVLRIDSRESSTLSSQVLETLVNSSMFAVLCRNLEVLTMRYGETLIAREGMTLYDVNVQEKEHGINDDSLTEDTPNNVSSREFDRDYLEQTKSLTPTHPISGEQGRFLRFQSGGGFRRPIFVTPSGKEFSLPDNIDEELERIGAKTIVINDRGFFTHGDKTIFDEP